MADVDESTFLSVIRVWAAVAWADGVIADAEAEAIRRLIESADLTDDERAEASTFLKEKVELDTGAIDDLGDNVRQGIYRAAYRLAKVNLSIADEERSFLVRLRAGLKLSDDVCQSLEASVDGNK